MDVQTSFSQSLAPQMFSGGIMLLLLALSAPLSSARNRALQLTGIQVSLTISAMTMPGDTGILAGLALAGVVSPYYALPLALSAMALMLLVVANEARLITR